MANILSKGTWDAFQLLPLTFCTRKRIPLRGHGSEESAGLLTRR